jgi:hypothetical protein
MQSAFPTTTAGAGCREAGPGFPGPSDLRRAGFAFVPSTASGSGDLFLRPTRWSFVLLAIHLSMRTSVHPDRRKCKSGKALIYGRGATDAQPTNAADREGDKGGDT